MKKPEATSFDRSTAFNSANVAVVFANYIKALEKNPEIMTINIWYWEETGIATIRSPQKVLASYYSNDQAMNEEYEALTSTSTPRILSVPPFLDISEAFRGNAQDPKAFPRKQFHKERPKRNVVFKLTHL